MNFKKILNTKKYRIALIISAAALVVLLFSINIILSGIINNIVKPKLLGKINSNEINVKVENASYSIFTNRITVTNAVISNYKDADTLNIKINSVGIKPDWFHLAFKDGYNFHEIMIDEVIFNQSYLPGVDSAKENEKTDFPALVENLRYKLPRFYADYIGINSGFITRHNKKTGLTDSIQNISLKIDYLEIDSSAAVNKKLKIAENINMTIEKAGLYFGEIRYSLSFDSLLISSQEDILSLRNLDFSPYMSDANFFRGRIYRADRFRLSINKFDITRLNFQELFYKNTLYADSLRIAAFTLDALTNMRLPSDPNGAPPEMPNKAIEDIPFKLNLKKIELISGNIFVKELYPYDEKPGILQFADLDASITGVKNNGTAHLLINTKLTGSGALNINFDLGLNPDEFRFSYSGKLKSMAATDLNKFIVVSDRVQVMTGNIKEITFNINAKGDSASATVTPYYSELKIHELDEETGKASDLISKFNSFVANTFVIKKNNPDGDEQVQSASTVYIRKKDDAFLEYVWIALRKALGSIVGFS